MGKGQPLVLSRHSCSQANSHGSGPGALAMASQGQGKLLSPSSCLPASSSFSGAPAGHFLEVGLEIPVHPSSTYNPVHSPPHGVGLKVPHLLWTCSPCGPHGGYLELQKCLHSHLPHPASLLGESPVTIIPNPFCSRPALKASSNLQSSSWRYWSTLEFPVLSGAFSCESHSASSFPSRYRARVERTESSTKVHVFYVDYGNVSVSPPPRTPFWNGPLPGCCPGLCRKSSWLPTTLLNPSLLTPLAVD